MSGDYAELLKRLHQRLLGPRGRLELDRRRDIIEGRLLEGVLNAFVVKVRANPASIQQRDIDVLKASGVDEDEIFDAAVCAAFRAGLERYEAALAVLEESG